MSRDWRDVSLRIGLIGVALILFAIAWDIWMHGEAFRDLLSLVLSFVALLFGMGTLILALVQRLSRRASWLVLIGAILAVLASAYLTYRTYTPLTTSHTDNEMIAQFAVESLKNGEDPYIWNYADMLRVFREQGINYTPFLDGAFQHRLTYPALPTLFYYGLDGLGVDLGQGEVRAAGLIAFLALLILLFVGAPEPLRPLVVLPLFVFRDLLSWPLNGVQDVVWSALLVGMIAVWKRPLWRALLYGLACSFRQQPWFVAPFLLIYLWHHEQGTPRQRLRPIALFVLISTGVFVATNLPFFIWDPGAWLQGALEPTYAAFNTLSHGPGILTEYGIVELPRQFYTALQASSLAIMLILYWFYAPAIGQGFWIFPGLFFWLYYRGLPSYWAYWIPVMLLAVAGGVARTFASGSRSPPMARRPRHAIPVMLVTGVLLANTAWAGTLLAREPKVEVSYSPPIETFYTGLANRLRVIVRNRSDRVLTPRFAVRPDYGVQTLPWRILSGPEQLGPGDVGEYVIDAKTMLSRGFDVGRGAQLVVTDAGGDYALHATLDVPPQTHYENPDLIANPDYLYWPQDGTAPLEWTLIPPDGATASTSLQAFEGRTALSMEATGTPISGTLPLVRVQQTVTFPERFTIWVYRTSTVVDPEASVYGVEIDDGDHRLWILFGESDQQVTPDPGSQRSIYRRALLDAWSLETIDLGALYEQLGWRRPLSSLRLARGVRYAVPQVKLSLIASARTADRTEWVFGPIDQDGSATSPDALVDYALQHPDEYYVDVGDKYRSQRNYTLAQDAYSKALATNAANSAAHFGLGESNFWLGNYAQARGEFQQALALGYPRRGEACKGAAWSEYNLGNYQAAIRQFDDAARAFVARDSPDDELSLADAYNGLGWAWLRLDDCDRATAYFKQALDVTPTLAGAMDGLALCEAPSH